MVEAHDRRVHRLVSELWDLIQALQKRVQIIRQGLQFFRQCLRIRLDFDDRLQLRRPRMMMVQWRNVLFCVCGNVGRRVLEPVVTLALS